MNESQIEAIATADAHTNNAGLPTYSELVALLRRANDNTSCYFADPATEAISMDIYWALTRIPQ